MANICESKITVVGLDQDPENFVRELSKAMFQIDLDNLDPKQWGEDPEINGQTWYARLVDQYRLKGSYPFTYCILYPHEPYSRLGVTAPRFHVDTKWEPPQQELMEASKVFPELTFHLWWWLELDGPTGECVIKHGEIVDEIRRPASWYLFDHALLYPSVGLLSAHLPLTLAQRGALRVEDAINTIEDLRNILDDDRFLASPQTPFSECRDKKKTETLRLRLAELHESMVVQAKQLDFNGVFLEEQELTERYPALVESDKALMERLGLEPLQPAAGAAARFSILPFQVPITKDPDRIVLPVLAYLNADPVSGKYQKGVDGSVPPIECEIRSVCLRPSDVRQIKSLPDDDQTPLDIDIIMKYADGRAFGYEFCRASNKARWRANPDLVKEVEREATKVSAAFVAKVADQTGMTIVADFRAVVETLFPKTANRPPR